jgi:hypothetical protein
MKQIIIGVIITNDVPVEHLQMFHVSLFGLF